MKVALCGVASSRLCLGQKIALEYSAKISTNGQLAKIICTCLWNKAQKLIRWKLNNGLTLAKTKHWLGVSRPSLLAPTVYHNVYNKFSMHFFFLAEYPDGGSFFFFFKYSLTTAFLYFTFVHLPILFHPKDFIWA